MLNRPKPFVLLTLNGFAGLPEKECNTIVAVTTLFWSKLITCSYADSVRAVHTGVMDAAVGAGGKKLFTAGYGYFAQMREGKSGQPFFGYTTHQEALACAGGGMPLETREHLSGLASAMLDILGIPQPVVMPGRSLLAAH